MHEPYKMIVLKDLKIAKNEIEKIINIIQERPFCEDIFSHIETVRKSIIRLNINLLDQYIENHIRDGYIKDSNKERFEEITAIIKKYSQ
jgi:DNA-binding FrmR family transcriptional regulator